MTGPTECQILGGWRIVESDIWDGDYLNLVDPATIAFGCIQAGMVLEYGRTIVFFRYSGCDEGDKVTGSGSAELNDDGTLEIELSFDNGDDVVLKARRM